MWKIYLYLWSAPQIYYKCSLQVDIQQSRQYTDASTKPSTWAALAVYWSIDIYGQHHRYITNVVCSSADWTPAIKTVHWCLYQSIHMGSIGSPHDIGWLLLVFVYYKKIIIKYWSNHWISSLLILLKWRTLYLYLYGLIRVVGARAGYKCSCPVWSHHQNFCGIFRCCNRSSKFSLSPQISMVYFRVVNWS